MFPEASLRYPGVAGHCFTREHLLGEAPLLGGGPRHEKLRRDVHREPPAVWRYALRRVPAQDALDVVADTFLVAWRRATDRGVPPGPRAQRFGTR
jgi:hypothetical protein